MEYGPVFENIIIKPKNFRELHSFYMTIVVSFPRQFYLYRPLKLFQMLNLKILVRLFQNLIPSLQYSANDKWRPLQLLTKCPL